MRLSVAFPPILALLLLLSAACSPAAPASPAATSTQVAAPGATAASVTVLPTVAPTEALPTEAVSTKPDASQVAATDAPPTKTATLAAEITATPPTAEPAQGRLLAFLRDGDIWLLDSPQSSPYQLTLAGDILSFAWSPDGERLAAFNGRSLCFFHRDGSVRTACLELGLNESQIEIERRIAWSPGGGWIVLWNAINPQDEDSLGWLVVALGTSNTTWRIQDPVDWGAALAPDNEPGGFTGEPLFLAEDRLIGTLSHRYLCGAGNCGYQLFELPLDELAPAFQPFPNRPEDGWSEGRSLQINAAGDTLTNFGVSLFDCETAHTFADRFNLLTGERRTYSLENLSVADMAVAPDEQTVLLSTTAACAPVDVESWSRVCGLTDGVEVLGMRRWTLSSGEIESLPPGLRPQWSPDGTLVAFESCLAQTGDGWQPSAETPASIYVLDASGEIQILSAGRMPAWQPR